MEGDNDVILWVDLRKSRSGTLPPGVAEQFAVYQVHDTQQIESTIRKVKPQVACFEYDYPDKDGLAALTQAQHLHPVPPIVVISAHYSEALAVRALRARAWDYIVKPYPIADTLRAVIVLSKRANETRANHESPAAPTRTPFVRDQPTIQQVIEV